VSTAGRSHPPSGLASLAPRLRLRVGELTAAVGERIHAADLSAARTSNPPSGALLRGVEQYLLHLLERLDDHDSAHPATAAPDDVSTGSLLRSYRISTQVLWDALRAGAEQQDDVAPDELVRLATHLWRHHDAACAALERDRSATERRERPRPEHREALVADLLEGRARRPVDARDAAAYLKLRPVSRYVVVVMDAVTETSAEDLELRTADAGFVSAWQCLPDQHIGIIDLCSAELDVLRTALAEVVTGRAGVSPVVNRLADLPTARRHADTAALTLPAGETGIAVLEHDLPGALLVSSPDLAGLLLQRFLGPVLALDASEREPLLATVQAYAATGASATDTARVVRCHRNTVLNRVRRFEVLSGQSLEHPEALLTTWLATRAHALQLRT
jgi:hypothetical protein